jgi:predicted Ser/Thr protein kinase
LASTSPPDERDDDERQSTLPRLVSLGASRVDTVAEEFLRGLSRRRTVVGDVLAGRYRVLRELGDGGMGQVFVAENLAIGQKVAIKVLKPDLLANDDFRKRFQKEAEAIAAIEHQNVVRFIDLVVGDPTFLVMEYVDGPTLSAVLTRDQRLVWQRAAELTRRLCWGLDASHGAGVIHRDVKPSNILVANDAELGEQPKLIDFGVAKTVSKTSEIQLTRHGQIVGTPHYMCPEQITSGDVDARSDVYALGCVLYQMVTGRPPFVGTEEYQILKQHVERTPESLDTLVADAPPELDRVVRRALAKDPSLRFATMREMARALADVLRDHPRTVTSDAPTTTTTRVFQRLPLPPLLPTLALALVAAALGGGGVWLALHRPASMASGLIVASEPAGAAVEVDGRAQRETTPVALAGIAPGEHVIRLRADGHDVVERHVQVRAGVRALVEVTLPPSSHRVTVSSAPAAASVYLDGKLVLGTTPTVMTVVDDDFHEVKLERAGYQPVTHAIKPDDRQSELVFTLEPESEPRGSLSVESNGAAQVWVDGRYSGFDTPTLAFRLPVGEHTVELRDASARSSTARINLHKGESIHLTIGLVRAP